MRESIPSPVFESIQSHLRSVGESAVTGWEANQAEEDSLTGDLGRLLSANSSQPIIVNGKTWHWRIRYKKFRGRGDDAFEKTYGADGIIQIEATFGGTTLHKGILFQAKKATRFRPGELRKQLVLIEGVAPGGSAVLLYDPTGYRAVRGSELLHFEEGLVGPAIRRMQPLPSFFDDFLECKNGIRGMYYEAVRERLLLPTIDGQIRAVPLEIRSRIKIDIIGQ
jgi:hypothetical protein